MYILFAILIFGFLIFIHELGHFLTAKALDVQVNEFSICMGPAILKKQKGETLYSLRCIPVGGYCAMEGEDEESDNPRAFTSKVWWKRLIILAAGSFMNFLTGLVVLALIYSCVSGFSTAKISGFFDGCRWNLLRDFRSATSFIRSTDGACISTPTSARFWPGIRRGNSILSSSGTGNSSSWTTLK